MKQNKTQEIFSIHLTKDNYKNVFVLEQGKLFAKKDDDKITQKSLPIKSIELKMQIFTILPRQNKPFMSMQYIYIYINIRH